MSNVKTLSATPITGPMYSERPSHEGSSPYKRQAGPLSPPLAGTRGYPYPQDPAARSYAASSHSHIPVYVPAQVYRETAYTQPDGRPPSDYSIERYRESAAAAAAAAAAAEQQQQQQQHIAQQQIRRRPSLLPTPEYQLSASRLERERYQEQFRYAYEREVAMPAAAPMTLTSLALAPTVNSTAQTVVVSSGHLSASASLEVEGSQPNKRPRLSQAETKAPLHQPLLIDTREIVEVKKEPAYTPQVEAISPTLPSEEARSDSSPQRSSKEEILTNINRIDREISQVELQVVKLKKKQQELEAEANKPPDTKQDVPDVAPLESKQLSMAQIIYSENRKKAQQAHSLLEKLGPKIDLPMYNQPTDTSVYHENKRKFLTFKKRLVAYFKKRHQEKEIREKYLTETYNQLMQVWLKKMEKKENNANRKAKEAKTREFFEKQFPELKKQREDKERFSRVGQRIRSDAELEEIMDGLQEQEMEDKKMRSYAVIPPILLDARQRRLRFINENGLVEDLMTEYKERHLLNIWTDQEKDIFREKYLQHPKNFGLIASCLERKSVADCVQYYYLTKKSENYKQLLRKHSVKKRTRTLVKPQQQQQHLQNQSNTQSGVTTRQQEEIKTAALAAAAAAAAATCNSATTTTATTTTTTSASVSLSTSSEMTTVSASTTSTLSTTTPTSSSDVVPSLSTPSIPIETNTAVTTNNSSSNNSIPHLQEAEKEFPAPKLNNECKGRSRLKEKEGGEEAGDEMSDDNESNQNENGGAHPCAVCKTELENFSQSRPLTKSNCDMFGLKDSEITPDMRVCSSCRFKSVRRRYTQSQRCPFPTCKTPKKKLKRLRPLPAKWLELSPESKEPIIAELQIPPDANKCCSACFNRILRKLGNNPLPDDNSETSRWTDGEMELAKLALRQHGTNWTAVAEMVVTKTKEQCKNFYFNYKRKLGLSEIVREYRETQEGRDQQTDGKAPPALTDEEESGETTSSCEEDNCVDRCSSDTASAPSPTGKTVEDGSRKDVSHKDRLQDGRDVNDVSAPPLQETKGLSSSMGSLKSIPDYDSSATVSADEGQGPNETENEPRLVRTGPTPNTQQIPPSPAIVMLKEPTHVNSTALCLPPRSPLEHHRESPSTHEHPFNIPVMKTVSKEINTNTIRPELLPPPQPQPTARSYLMPITPNSAPSPGKIKKDETCVRDLINQAVEYSLQWPMKPRKNSVPVPPSFSLQSIVTRDREKEAPSREPTLQEVKRESVETHSVVPMMPPAAHKASRQPLCANLLPSNAVPIQPHPEGLTMITSSPYPHNMIREPQMDSEYEVQDLSKKDKPRERDYSPPRDYTSLKKEKVVHPVRPPADINYATSHSPYSQYTGPPPAHQYGRSQQQSQQQQQVAPQPAQPPPEMPHTYIESVRETYYQRQCEPRSKLQYSSSDRPHSQPPNLVAQALPPVPPSTTPPSRPISMSKPNLPKSPFPPPPPLITAAKPSPLSPKLSYKEKLVPPSGSITQGTPMAQQSVPSGPPVSLAHASPCYEGLLRQLPPPHPKDAGSITLGTPVQHDPGSKRVMSTGGRQDSASTPVSNYDGSNSSSRGTPVSVAEGLPRPGLSVMYDPANIEQYYRRMSPTGPYPPYPPGYNAYPQSQAPPPPPPPPPRPPYPTESLSSKQIMIDFNTSKQMQMRLRGNSTEKEARASPRTQESSPHPPAVPPQVTGDHRILPMYASVPYPPASALPHSSQPGAPMYLPVSEVSSRFQHHPGSPLVSGDRPHTPVVEQLSPSWSQSSGKPPHSPNMIQGQGIPRQNVIQRSIPWGTGKPSVIQAPKSASPRAPEVRTETISPAPISNKRIPSPRHPHPGHYQPMQSSGHDAFNTLVNAAAAQPSLAIPKEEKRTVIPSSGISLGHPDISRSPRDRPAVEGLEKSLMDLHQRPRSYSESGHVPASHHHHERYRSDTERGRASTESLPSEAEREPHHQQRLLVCTSVGGDEHRYVNEHRHHIEYEHANSDQRCVPETEKQRLLIVEHQQPTSLRLPGVREPFTKEQFERELRQPDVGRSSRDRELKFSKKEDDLRSKHIDLHERSSIASSSSLTRAQQSELDNEASRIFSQSFQKDSPKTVASNRGFTAANLIDAIITHQINQNTEGSSSNKKSPVDALFSHYRNVPENDSRPSRDMWNAGKSCREEVVTIDEGPPPPSSRSAERHHYPRIERPGSTNRSPAMSGDPHQGVTLASMTDKALTLAEHIDDIISKNYSTPNEIHTSQPMYTHSQLGHEGGTTNSAGCIPLSRATTYSSVSSASGGGIHQQMIHIDHRHPSAVTVGRPLEGIAAAAAAASVTPENTGSSGSGDVDHGLQNCPGSGCGQQGWKLRRALQQDKEKDQRSPGPPELPPVHQHHHHPPPHHIQVSTGGSTAVSVGQDERQIIRVVQPSPSTPHSRSQTPNRPRTPQVTQYAVEPISPPGQPVADNCDTNIHGMHGSEIMPPSSCGSQVQHRTAPSPIQSQGHPTHHQQHAPWLPSPNVSGLLTRRSYGHESSEPPPVSSAPSPLPPHHYHTSMGRITPSSSSSLQSRPHQQQMGLSPLDYVKNRIEEVMRTASDESIESQDPRFRSSASSQHGGRAEEREHLQPSMKYRGSQQAYESEYHIERPLSTGSNASGGRESVTPHPPPHRFSPAAPGNYPPPPPHHMLQSPSLEQHGRASAISMEASRSYRRNPENMQVSGSADWREGSVTPSRIRPTSISPSSSDIVLQDGEEGSRKRLRMDTHYAPESSSERGVLLLPENSENTHVGATSGHRSDAGTSVLSTSSEQMDVSSHVSQSRASPQVNSDINGMVTGNSSVCASPADTYPHSSQRESDGLAVESSTSGETKHSESQWEVSSGMGEGRSGHEGSSQLADSPSSGDMVIDESAIVNSASSSKIEPVSPPSQEGISTTENVDVSEQATSSSTNQVGSSSSLRPDPNQSNSITSSLNRNSPAPTPSTLGTTPPVIVSSPGPLVRPGCYSPYNASGNVSSTVGSSSPMCSSSPSSSVAPSVSSSQQPGTTGHFPTFSGVNTTYTYPYSALSVRSMNTATAQRPGSSPSSSLGCNPGPTATSISSTAGGSHVQSSTVSGSSSSSSNSPSSFSRDNQPAPLLSSQYEPLSDED